MAGKLIRGITIEIGGVTAKLDKALESPEKKARSLQNELKKVNAALKLDPKNTELLAQKQKILKEAVQETKTKLDTLKDAEKQVQEQFEKGEVSEEQYRELQREISNTEAELKKLEDEARSCASTLEKAAEVTGKIGEKSTELGKKIMPFSAGVAAAGVASVKFGSDFNDSMAKASTLIDTSVYDMDGLKEKILEVSDRTGVAAERLGESMYNALSASVPMGEEGADMMAFLESNTRLARVGFTNIDTAVTATAKTINAYGKDVSETDQIHKVLLQTQNLGIATVDELGENLAKVTPTAAAMNVSFEQVGAALSVMTAKGTPAAQATTQLNALITELGKEGTRASDILRDKTGQSFKGLMDEGYTLTDVLALMQGELGGSTAAVMDLMSQADEATGQAKSFEEACTELGISSDDAEQELIDMFGSVQAGKTALALGGENAAWFTENLAAMSDEADVVGESFDKMETDSYKMSVALNEVKNVGTQLGTTSLNMLQPIIQGISDKVKQFSEWFGKLSDSQKKTIVTIMGIVAALGPALLIFGKVMTAVSGIISVVSKVGPVIKTVQGAFSAFGASLLTNPIFLIVAAIIAIIAVFVLLYNKCEWFRNAVNAIWEGIKTVFFAVWDGIKAFFTEILPGVLDKVAGFFTGLWDGIKNVFSGIGNWFKDRFTQAAENSQAAWSAISGFFSNVWSGIKNVFSNVGGWFQEKFTQANQNAQLAFSAIGGFFKNRWSDIKSAFSAVGSFFGNTFRGAWSNITNAFSNVGGFFSNLWNTIVSRFTDIGVRIGDAVGGAFKAGINGVLATVERVVNGFIGMINGVIGFINNIPGVNLGSINPVNLPRLAKGGVLRNGMAMVAEAGPELIRQADGQTFVTPLTDSARNKALGTDGGQGVRYEQNVNLYSPRELNARETARQMRNQTRRLILSVRGGGP